MYVRLLQQVLCGSEVYTHGYDMKELRCAFMSVDARRTIIRKNMIYMTRASGADPTPRVASWQGGHAMRLVYRGRVRGCRPTPRGRGGGACGRRADSGRSRVDAT